MQMGKRNWHAQKNKDERLDYHSKIDYLSNILYVSPAMAETFLKWGCLKPVTKFSSPTTRAGSGVARNFERGRGAYISSVSFSVELIGN